MARSADANKYTVGVVAVVGGCDCYPSAPVIAGLGARAAGAGLVRLVVPDASRAGACALLPEATFAPLADGVEFPKADVFVAGMGLGQGESAAGAIKRLLSSPGRFVLDADALSVLAAWRGSAESWSAGEGRELILTPHEGEAARLLGSSRADIAANRERAVREIARRYGATAVLKGPGTLVAAADSQRVYTNCTGNPLMALGGMGDLLAGAIGARWAYLKADAFAAAAGAVWLHGAAGDALAADGCDPSIVNTATRLGAPRARFDAAQAARLPGKSARV